nr:hypothetical protein [Lentzea atacamensis]
MPSIGSTIHSAWLVPRKPSSSPTTAEPGSTDRNTSDNERSIFLSSSPPAQRVQEVTRHHEVVEDQHGAFVLRHGVGNLHPPLQPFPHQVHLLGLAGVVDRQHEPDHTDDGADRLEHAANPEAGSHHLIDTAVRTGVHRFSVPRNDIC